MYALRARAHHEQHAAAEPRWARGDSVREEVLGPPAQLEVVDRAVRADRDRAHRRDAARMAQALDECLAHAAVDVSGRPYFVHTGEPEYMVEFTIAGSSAPYHTVVNRHVFESLAYNARIALHVRTLYGRDPHHITEAEYKAVARALRQAVEFDPRVTGVPSTKGTL